jgi:hypothetical protein
MASVAATTWTMKSVGIAAAMNTPARGFAVSATLFAAAASFSTVGFPFGIRSGCNPGTLGRSALAMRAIFDT